MAIEVECRCGTRISVPDHFAGKVGKCKACGERLVIPEPGLAGLVDVISDDDVRRAMEGIRLDAGDDQSTSSPAEVAPTPGPYFYRMVQLAPTVMASDQHADRGSAAVYLERIVNKQALDGWEFQRIDAFLVEQPTGCLAALFGMKPDRIQLGVTQLVFRGLAPSTAGR
jgi:hypothetical protein